MAKRPSKWVVCYIDSSKIRFLEEDMSRFPKYRSLKVYIPKIKVLKKKFKGKQIFEEIPLLFNYGFFEVPDYFLPNPHFLVQMKKEIRCIYTWVRDPARETNKNELQKLSWRYTNGFNPHSIALASSREIVNLIKQEKLKETYTAQDLSNIKVNSIVTLKGYPFEGLSAEVMEIDYHRKEMVVKLLLQTYMSKVKISFDNVFFNIYNSEYMNTEMKERSLDEMEGNNINIDSLLKNL